MKKGGIAALFLMRFLPVAQALLQPAAGCLPASELEFT